VYFDTPSEGDDFDLVVCRDEKLLVGALPGLRRVDLDMRYESPLSEDVTVKMATLAAIFTRIPNRTLYLTKRFEETNRTVEKINIYRNYMFQIKIVSYLFFLSCYVMISSF